MTKNWLTSKILYISMEKKNKTSLFLWSKWKMKKAKDQFMHRWLLLLANVHWAYLSWKAKHRLLNN